MLNENIKALRKKQGLSQEELANRLHVVRQTISKWEQNLSVPDAEMLRKLAAELGTTTAILLGESVPDQQDEDTVEVLAEKLAQLNDQWARRQEIRRKRWRIACMILAIAAGGVLLWGLSDLLYGWYANASLAADVGIIGGADVPTSIYLSRFDPRWMVVIVAAVIGIFAVFGLKKTRN